VLIVVAGSTVIKCSNDICMLRLSPQQIKSFVFEDAADLIDMLQAEFYVIDRRGIKACYSSHDSMVNTLLKLVEETGMECTPFTPMICDDGERRSVILDFEDSCIVLILNPVIQLKILEKYDKAIAALGAEVAQDGDSD